MKRRLLPSGGGICETVFHPVEMEIIHARRVVTLVTNCAFPEVPLPDAAFVAAQTSGGTVLFGRHCFAERLFSGLASGWRSRRHMVVAFISSACGRAGRPGIDVEWCVCPDRRAQCFDLIPSCLKADASTGRKHFFLKKEAKTFGHLAYASGQR